MASSDAIRAGKTVVEVGGDDSALAGVLRGLQQKLAAWGANVRNTGLAVMGAGLAMATPFGFAVSAASDALETLNKFTAVFGDQAESADQFAIALGQSIGRGTTEIRDGMSALMAQFVGLGFGREEAARMAQELTALSYDFGSFFNVSDEDALGRFISAMSGSGEVLDRFGINIKAAALDQEFLAMGLNVTSANATEQQKALARFNIIRRTMDMQGAAGDAAKTADSFANTIKRLKAQLKDSAEAIGSAIIPVITQIATVLADSVQAFAGFARKHQAVISAVASGIGALIGIGAALTGIGSAISVAAFGLGGLAAAVSFLSPLLVPLAIAIAGIAGPALVLWGVLSALDMTFSDLWDVIVDTWDALTAGIDTLDLITAAVLALGAGLALTFGPLLIVLSPLLVQLAALAGLAYLVYDNWSAVKSVISTLFDDWLKGWALILEGGHAVVGFLGGGLVPMLTDTLGGVWGALVDGASSAWGTLRNVVSSGVEAIRTMIADFTTAFGGISDAISTGDWAGAFNIAWLSLQLAFQVGKNWLLVQWSDLKFNMLTMWDTLVGLLAPTLQPALQAIVGLFFDMAEAVVEVINSIVRSLPQRLRDRLGIGELSVSGREEAMAGINAAFAPTVRERNVVDTSEEERLREELGRSSEQAAIQAYIDSLGLASIDEMLAGMGGGLGTQAVGMAAVGGTSGSFSAAALSNFGAQSAMERTANGVDILVQQLVPGVNRVGDLLEGGEEDGATVT